MTAIAELLEDGGAAASGSDFFRSPRFLTAEAATHTLRVTGGSGTLVAPLLVREIPGSEMVDAISPYGVTVTSLPISAEQIVERASAGDGRPHPTAIGSERNGPVSH